MKKLFLAAYFLLLLTPFSLIFDDDSFSTALNSGEDIILFFVRLSALFGVTLLFIQIILGAFMPKFIEVFGAGALRWHIRQGIITYGIVLLHPFLYTVYTATVSKNFNPLMSIWPNFSDPKEYYITFGRIALFLLTIGVFSAIFRSQPFLIKNWRKFHILNYITFALILFHSWNVGSDTKEPPFIFLYPVFVGGLVVSSFYRRVYRGVKGRK